MYSCLLLKPISGFRAALICFAFVYGLINRAWNSLWLQSQIALYLDVTKCSRSYCHVICPCLQERNLSLRSRFSNWATWRCICFGTHNYSDRPSTADKIQQPLNDLEELSIYCTYSYKKCLQGWKLRNQSLASKISNICLIIFAGLTKTLFADVFCQIINK